MTASAKRSRIAWIALCAILFSAMSSALAAYHFSDRVDFLTEVCTVAGIKKVAAADAGEDRQKPGKDGAVYCAECLASASAPVIETPPAVAMFAFVAGSQAMPATETTHVHHAAVLPPPSRGPPAVD